jgi:hypothetical protein
MAEEVVEGERAGNQPEANADGMMRFQYEPSFDAVRRRNGRCGSWSGTKSEPSESRTDARVTAGRSTRSMLRASSAARAASRGYPFDLQTRASARSPWTAAIWPFTLVTARFSRSVESGSGNRLPPSLWRHEMRSTRWESCGVA